jgi:glucosamine--fructose-6-phosphate aminotransferase (isomerizing)
MTGKYDSYTDIFAQPESLYQTLRRLAQAEKELDAIYRRTRPQAIALIGCGTSYTLSISVAAVMQRRLGIPVYAIAGGDLLRHPRQYAPVLQSAMLMTCSRSGSTTETLYAVERARREYGRPLLSITGKPDSPLARLADVSLSLPWSMELAVCQNRSVNNFYLAGMWLAAKWGGDRALLGELEPAIAAAARALQHSPIEHLELFWRRAVVLADGELYGLAATGALSLLEMAQIPTLTYYTLDVRHGPVVGIDAQTLVVLIGSLEGRQWEEDLLRDLARLKAAVYRVSADMPVLRGTGLHSDAAMGLVASVTLQMLAYRRAVAQGLNPDRPVDLTSWIDLADSRAAVAWRAEQERAE